VSRLLFITERFPPDIGGLASSADRITKVLCQLGVEVDVLTWSKSLPPGEVLLPKPSIPQAPQLYRVGRYRHWDMTMPLTLNLLEWLQQRRQYNALWGHYLFPGGFLATWFAELKSLPSIVSARGNDIDREMFPPGDFGRLQWTLERASLVTAVSADIARKIQVVSRRDDVVVLKNAVNDQIFAPAVLGDDGISKRLRESLEIAADEVVLGFAGELREKKGQKFLLHTLTTVRAQRPACLLIIGEVRESQEAVLHLYGAEYPEARSRVIVTGHLPEPADVAKHMQLCDVYLQPSLWDGMPNALLEAMACGCCCIASDAGGIPEIITHGVNGFMLPCSQLHHLGEAVLECLELDAEIRHKIGMAGRGCIQSEFSLDVEKARLQIVLDRVGISAL
jgi:glycosyltransferase involved in cell wall biosynthesis